MVVRKARSCHGCVYATNEVCCFARSPCSFRRTCACPSFSPPASAVQVVGEGSVGVLRFGGRVLGKTKAPGFHFVLPFLYELTEVPVNVRT